MYAHVQVRVCIQRGEEKSGEEKRGEERRGEESVHVHTHTHMHESVWFLT